MNSEKLIKILKEFQGKHPEELEGEEKRLFDAIMDIADDRDKYKSLYENEKDHTDTLKRIIKKIEEILQKEYKENVFGHYEYDLATAKNTIKKILDLLKEIR